MMESIFITWMFACAIGCAVHYVYERLNGLDHESASLIFNKILVASSLAILVGGLVAIAIAVILILMSELSGFFDIWSFFDYLGNLGVAVFVFSNIAVSAAYLGYKGTG